MDFINKKIAVFFYINFYKIHIIKDKSNSYIFQKIFYS
jgi:hypothetical protein